MPVNATLRPAHVLSPPGAAATLTLHLHNDADVGQLFRLKAVGDLAAGTAVQSETIHLDAGERFDVPVIVDVATGLHAGAHTTAIDVTFGDDDDRVTAEATIDVEATSRYNVAFTPIRSMSAIAGKHRVTIDNAGNVPVTVELSAATETDAAIAELAAPVVSVDPEATARVELRVHARERFWTGAPREHPFTVRIAAGDDDPHDFHGVYEQGPRIRPWLLPAAAGMVAALFVGTLAWFALLKPWVESTAEDRATAVNEADQIRLDEKIAELDAAAAEARQLPLGSPADLRLDVDAAPGGSANESFTVASDRVLSATDVVFQNPGGAVGRIALLRSGEVLLESELANFRDLDFHFVAPFRFDGSDTVEIRVDCETPGPNQSSCIIGATVIGFVDEAP